MTAPYPDYSKVDYKLKIVQSIDEFNNLKEQWNGLAEKIENYKPFLCHEWFSLWIKHFLKNKSLYIVLLHCSNSLVAIAPLFLTVSKYKGLKIRKLELLGNVYSPIRNFIFETKNNDERILYINIIFDQLNIILFVVYLRGRGVFL